MKSLFIKINPTIEKTTLTGFNKPNLSPIATRSFSVNAKSKFRPSPSVLRKQREKKYNFKHFSSRSCCRSEHLKKLISLKEKMSYYPQLKEENKLNLQNLSDLYNNDCSVFLLTRNLLNIEKRLESSIYELARGEHIMDHYHIILEHSHPIEYGKLEDTTFPLRIKSLDNEYLVVKRMFNAHDFYFSSLYGKIHHILKQDNLLTEKCISEISTITDDLDKQYFIFKYISKEYKKNSDIYLKLTIEKEELDSLYSEFEQVKKTYFFKARTENRNLSESYFTYRGRPDMADLSLKGEIDLAYLAELPFCMDTYTPDRFIKFDFENLKTLSELPFSDLGDVFDDDILIFNIDYEEDDFDFYDTPLYEQAIFCLENKEGFANLPFSNLDDELVFDHTSGVEENLAGFANLPFSNLEDELVFDHTSEVEENLVGFANLPFSNLEDEHTSIIDTVYQVLEAFS